MRLQQEAEQRFHGHALREMITFGRLVRTKEQANEFAGLLGSKKSLRSKSFEGSFEIKVL